MAPGDDVTAMFHSATNRKTYNRTKEENRAKKQQKSGVKKTPLNLVSSNPDNDYVDISNEKPSPNNQKSSPKKEQKSTPKRQKEEESSSSSSEIEDIKPKKQKPTKISGDDAFVLYLKDDESEGYIYVKLKLETISKSSYWIQPSRKAFGFHLSTHVPGISPQNFMGGDVCAIVSEGDLKSFQKLLKNNVTTQIIMYPENADLSPYRERKNARNNNENSNRSNGGKKTNGRKIVGDMSDDEDIIKESSPKTKQIKTPKTVKTKPKDEEEYKPPKEEDISDEELVKKTYNTRGKSSSSKASVNNINNDEVVLKKYNINITKGDLARLEPGEFLNDNVIDFWFSHLEDKYKKFPEKVKKKFYIFNTHFYPVLKKDINRAAKRFPKGVKLFEKEMIFVPINEHAHWSLMVICNLNGEEVTKEKEVTYGPNDRVIMYCDSLGGSIPTSITKRLREYLSLRYKEEHENSKRSFNADNFPAVKASLPLQDNHCDCGVFMLHYIEMSIQHQFKELPIKKPELFQLSDISLKRELIRDEILLLSQQEPPTPEKHNASLSQLSDSVIALSQTPNNKDNKEEENHEMTSPIKSPPKFDEIDNDINNNDTKEKEELDIFTERSMNED
ncbi:hypothetical protein ABK040_016427 [Willaertia magna]